MRNIIDYVREEMATFWDKPFNNVDSLVLSQYAYLKLEKVKDFYPPEGIPLKDLYRAEFFDWLVNGTIDPKRFLEFFMALSASPRFRNVLLSDIQIKFDGKTTTQFCGMTFLLPDGNSYVAFRGTDLTIVGWKEDFDMAFSPTVPSQQESLRYLNNAMRQRPGNFFVGGHSKGGNLAVYAAIYCEEKDRIKTVFNHDGPGFKDNIQSFPEYQKISSKIRKTMPKSSLVGMLLEHQGDFSIVESDKFWLMQHNGFNWAVGDDDFIYTDHFTDGANFFNEALYSWLSSLTPEKREQFVNTLFGIAESCNIQTIEDLRSIKDIFLMLNAVKELDQESKDFLALTFRSFTAISMQNLRPTPEKDRKNRFPRLGGTNIKKP